MRLLSMEPDQNEILLQGISHQQDKAEQIAEPDLHAEDAQSATPPRDGASVEPEDLPAEDAQPGEHATTPPRDGASANENQQSTSSPILVTPPQRKRGRKLSSNPSEWKKNIRKKLKLAGKQYENSQGKQQRQRGKYLKPVDCSKCKRRCTEKVDEQKREDIFTTFYGMQSYERQKDFVCRHITQTETKTYLGADKQPVPKKRQQQRYYHFTVDGCMIPVCKSFMKTLDIGNAYIEHAITNSKDGSFCGEDGRGKHAPANKVPDEQISGVKRHIESFPAMESHYCRRGTTK